MFSEKGPYNLCQESPQEDSFEASGGRVLEYDDGGQPINWVCGKNERGELTHPAGVKEKDIISYVATGEEQPCSPCEWRGAKPDHPSVQDIDDWWW